MSWHLDGRRREGGGSGLLRPVGLEAAVPCQVPGPEAAAVVAGNEVGITGARKCALCRSGLLTCARALAAETGKFPGGDDRYAFLGVKGSPVQIRPSRLVVEFFRIYFYLTRASKRGISLRNGPSRGTRRSCIQALYPDICQTARASEAGQSKI